MRCTDLMKHDVERCLAGSLVTEAATSMRDRNVGFLPVCDEHGVAVGVLTDRDIAVRVLAERRAPDAARVDEAMTREVVSCSPDDDLATAEDLMIRFQKSRIVCCDADRRVLGVISLSDVAKMDARGHAGPIAAAVAVREAAPRANLRRGQSHYTRCGDLMSSHVACAAVTDGVGELAATMRSQNVGFLPVCDAHGAAVGALTDRDLVVRVVAERRAPEKTRAADVLTRELVHCSPEDPLSVAEDLMTRHRKSRVVCIDEARKAVGVISLSDVARVERYRRISRVLKDVSTRLAA